MRRKDLSNYTKGEIKCVAFFQKRHVKHRLLKLENLCYTSHHVSSNIRSKTSTWYTLVSWYTEQMVSRTLKPLILFSAYWDTKNICDPFLAISHPKRTVFTFAFGGVSGTIPKDRKLVLQKWVAYTGPLMQKFSHLHNLHVTSSNSPLFSIKKTGN